MIKFVSHGDSPCDILLKQDGSACGFILPKAKTLLVNLHRSPRITAAEVSAMLRATPKTANELIQNLVDLGILVESTGYKRNRVFSFAEYVKLFSE